jgi:hypothetical protein
MLTAMGGMKNYNATHFIQWDFVIENVMDKWTDVRIENNNESSDFSKY